MNNDILRQMLLSNLQLLSQTVNVSVGSNTGDLTGNLDGVLGNIGSSLFPNKNRQTLRAFLINLLNQQVTISTPLEPITGTLIAVQRDYVVMVESDGSLVLIPLSQIQTVTEM
ncbi:hypothetical protein J27TS8_17300 [Robertmurraya siralis]|uniref:DUF2642 domain-containing protein n=1 Tax=Robertmurraya siralis TaxID=77777 RepID=A0A919WHA5_9BACI|nr:DUF2642 domain-containing protein [Robertmurraya siralis]PAE21568.1 hypothetical protein CHH80_06635 [Bacillus sp. 7504-2]GIN61737.1 hypothetical protein J27TS8_17300 [Robertmurraya siralis]